MFNFVRKLFLNSYIPILKSIIEGEGEFETDAILYHVCPNPRMGGMYMHGKIFWDSEVGFCFRQNSGSKSTLYKGLSESRVLWALRRFELRQIRDKQRREELKKYKKRVLNEN